MGVLLLNSNWFKFSLADLTRFYNIVPQSRIEGAEKSSEAAALVVAKLVTRPDLHTEHLKPTLTQLINDCKAAENDVVFVSNILGIFNDMLKLVSSKVYLKKRYCLLSKYPPQLQITHFYQGSRTKLGTLTALCRIYKLGRRDYLLPHSRYVLQQLEEMSLGINHNTLLRKFETKLAQRIGSFVLVVLNFLDGNI